MSHSYNYQDRTIDLELDEDHVAVRFTEPSTRSTRCTITEGCGFAAYSKKLELPRERFTLLRVAPTPENRSVRLAAATEALDNEAEVVRVAPVFRVGAYQLVATDRVLVGFHDDKADIDGILDKYDCKLIERSDTNECVVRVNESKDPFTAVAELDAEDDVDYAEPDFVLSASHLPRSTVSAAPAATDPLIPKQYAVRITKTDQAWKHLGGDARITIAILDEGVDTHHPDLHTAVTGSYDGLDGDTFQEPNPWDGHGTACAGLAVASPNGIGVRGIGGGCSLLAVRIAESPAPSDR